MASLEAGEIRRLAIKAIASGTRRLSIGLPPFLPAASLPSRRFLHHASRLGDQIRSMSRDEFCAANLRNWDERVAIHRRDTTRFYAVERFLAGEKRLHAIDSGELGEDCW